MQKHEVTNIAVLFVCLIMIVILGILSFIKSDSKKWYIYIIVFAAVEVISIIYLAFL